MNQRIKSRDKIQNNITKQKLKGTPFNSAEELKAAQNELLSEIWKSLEKARIKKELLKRPEFEFINNIFKTGIVCQFNESAGPDHGSIRIHLDESDALRISINKKLRAESDDNKFIGTLIESISTTFLSNYLKSMHIIEDEQSIKEHKKLFETMTK